MKKFLVLFLFVTIISCNNTEYFYPEEYEKVICKENVDTILSHIKGWYVVDSMFTVIEDFHTTDKDGKKTVYFKYYLETIITDGIDTLTISTDKSDEEYNDNTYEFEKAWTGLVSSYNMPIGEENANEIKRHNLAIKRACSKDSCFELSIPFDDKIMFAHFIKYKPKPTELPLEDYGLTKDDV